MYRAFTTYDVIKSSQCVWKLVGRIYLWRSFISLKLFDFQRMHLPSSYPLHVVFSMWYVCKSSKTSRCHIFAPFTTECAESVCLGVDPVLMLIVHAIPFNKFRWKVSIISCVWQMIIIFAVICGIVSFF